MKNIKIKLLILSLLWVFSSTNAQVCTISSSDWLKDPKDFQWETTSYTNGKCNFRAYLPAPSVGVDAILISMGNPFFISQSGVSPEIYAIANSQDYKKEDGWELLSVQFGSLENGPRKYPYFILVNRYTGLLRVFLYANDAPVASGYVISLRLKDSRTGDYFKFPTTTSNEVYDYSLEDYQNKTETDKNISDVAMYVKTQAASPNTWILGEFWLGYDPIVLANISKTYTLEITFETVVTSTLEATINGESITQDFTLYGKTSDITNIPASGGIEATKKIKLENFKGFQAVNNINKANQDFKKKAIVLRDQLSANYGVSNTSKAYTGLTKISENPIFKGINSFVTTATAGVDLVNAGLGIYDAFRGVQTPDANKPEPITRATFTDYSLILDGELKTSSRQSTLATTVPGALNTDINNLFDKSYYNCATGILALKNTPQLQTVEYDQFFARTQLTPISIYAAEVNAQNGNVIPYQINYDYYSYQTNEYVVSQATYLPSDKVKGIFPQNSGSKKPTDLANYFQNKTSQRYVSYTATNDLEILENKNANVTSSSYKAALVAIIPEEYLLNPSNLRYEFKYRYNGWADYTYKLEVQNPILDDIDRGNLIVYDIYQQNGKTLVVVGTDFVALKNFKGLVIHLPKDDRIEVYTRIIGGIQYQNQNSKASLYYSSKTYFSKINTATYAGGDTKNFLNGAARPSSISASIPYYTQEYNKSILNSTLPNYTEDQIFQKTWDEGGCGLDNKKKIKLNLVSSTVDTRPLNEIYGGNLNTPYYSVENNLKIENTNIKIFNVYSYGDAFAVLKCINPDYPTLNLDNYRNYGATRNLKLQAGNSIELGLGVETEYGAEIEFVIATKPWVAPGNSIVTTDLTYACNDQIRYNTSSKVGREGELDKSGENEANYLEVSPNPVSDYVSIGTNLSEEVSLEILSVDGAVVYGSKFTGETNLDLGFLPVGTYIVRIYNEEKMVTNKLIKQ